MSRMSVVGDMLMSAMLPEKVKWIPCGLFVNDSEEKATIAIRNTLNAVDRGQWIILSNLMVSYQPEETPDEIDIVAIGSTAVIAIEIKHWDNSYVTRNPNVVASEAHKLENKVRRLKRRLSKHFGNMWVKGVFLFTKGQQFSDSTVQGIPIFSLQNLPDLFAISTHVTLNEKQREKCLRLLQPLSEAVISGRLKNFRDIENLKLLTSTNERFHREYSGVKVKSRERVILHWYDLTASTHKKPEELAEREYLSYKILQKEPFIPKIVDSFQSAAEYPGEVYFYSIQDSMAPTLHDRRNDDSWTVKQRLAFAVECFKALRHMHTRESPEQPIFHRGLNPFSVLVGSDNKPLFTGFRWARIVEAVTISPAQLPLEGECVAPEVLQGGLASADGRSDVFSLCATLKSALSDSPEALSLLNTGMSEKPGDRASLDTLIEGLESLYGPQTQVVGASEVEPKYWAYGTRVALHGDLGNTVYQVIEFLGAGGVGRTFKVVQLDVKTGQQLGLYVAKTIDTAENAEYVLKAYRLARGAHPKESSASIYEIADIWDPCKPMALLEWIEGTPLSSYSAILPLYAEELNVRLEKLILGWVASISRVLAHFHRKGLVHGDVSPGNIIVNGLQVTLTDYDGVTNVGEIARHFNSVYGAPEVISRHPVSASDDIYALAATIYWVITEKTPFLRGSSITREQGLDLDGEVFAEMPDLTKFLERATLPNREHRFVDGDAVLNYLSDLPSMNAGIRDDSLRSTPASPEVNRLSGSRSAAPDNSETKPHAPKGERTSGARTAQGRAGIRNLALVRAEKGKYGGFTTWLRGHQDSEVSLEFAEVEKIIGCALPPSARKHRPYWHGGQSGSTIGNAILAAGWIVTDLDMREERVALKRGN